MPTKADRAAPLPANLVPLLTQKQMETYYGVSDWQILQWIKAGMPTEPFAGRGRRFSLAKCEEWHAENDEPVSEEADELVASA